ncbi:DUF948 domain-containing protein [[Brevibacterium] frigoritolerans]|uniref:DUF948 domain-containing protein n=1 Tax=Peribacillus frigoritolerans TaxID=450367 RepID=A0A941FJ46_9BACI|nr:DUF948 domain-containing protein [Peribacillus frigoritolerans]
MEEVRNAVHGLTQESKQLIHSANQITADVKGKMEKCRSIAGIRSRCWGNDS